MIIKSIQKEVGRTKVGLPSEIYININTNLGPMGGGFGFGFGSSIQQVHFLPGSTNL